MASLRLYESLVSQLRRPMCSKCSRISYLFLTNSQQSRSRPFSTTTSRQNWLQPFQRQQKKSPKGRPRVPTGGSVRGTTVVWGEYGLRLVDKGRRISSAHLKLAEETIKKRLRGTNFSFYPRVQASIGVYVKGKDQRMGKGKGSFDHWAARMSISQIVFEISGVHEEVAKDALRRAGNKLPGVWQFAKKGDPPVMGVTPLVEGVTFESLKRARRTQPLHPLHKFPDGTRAGDSQPPTVGAIA